MVLWIAATRTKTPGPPAPLANRHLPGVASRERSQFVSEALAARLAERDFQSIRSCDVANGDPDVAEIEKEFDAMAVEIA